MLLPNWPMQHVVGGLSTTRAYGCSNGPFTGLNLAYHVGDSAVDVDANHHQLLNYLPCPAHWLTQVHGAEVVEVNCEQPMYPWPKADALYTRLRQQPLAIMTADCLPILVCDQQGLEVAAIHAGWKPLVKGIIGNTLGIFQSSPKQLVAWLGPAIGAQQFEVGGEVKSQFCDFHKAHTNDFIEQGNGKYLGDIYAIARRQLNLLGVGQVFGGEYCTVSQRELFFSYRRDGQTGRMASLIWRN
ncbi:Polyphenol oxidase [Pseudoalteromonas holothuriae]|uniref:Purine nucleoside phosphorylase n=1 Tax=Pseudoalteromonas holothuriae TaxID=2963714 RepID=A0A9W4R391_9GAMM|nr:MULTISPECIES: peptidoglycan editing factor PgeF [unclassified Pseudoalteromonas]CAH9063747.1 Polyphenol oxidase [Pseudoalteromonas sp. CIP111951]CAH9064849.1 Polyphenol oxidase [Pseudoalteromonas sp. CIP111854]